MLLNLFLVLVAAAALWFVNTRPKLDRLPKVGFSIAIAASVLFLLIIGAAP